MRNVVNTFGIKGINCGIPFTNRKQEMLPYI